MDAAATNELEDEGDVEGYPREGLCLAVLGDGRAHPAWLCRTRAPAANGRRRVLLYGDGRGASRALNPSERVDPLPGDAALCARLQQDWKDASPGDRDGLLRALDELEARRCAPPSFGAMVKSVRATMAKGPMSAFAPSACLGREFYPNLFPPRVGDAVRVLWDGDVWYEATATGKGDADARADGPARTAAAEKGPAVACGAFYGFDSGEDRELRVRYVEDGTRDSLAWPDPEGEAWLLGPPRRRPPTRIAGGLLGRRRGRRRCAGSAVVTLDGADGDMLAGERGVVAASDIAQGAAAPYAGVVVTDAELGDLLRRAPRAAARWLMYRYEFAGASLSVLPYLGCGNLSPAPFINCARGPSAKEALVVGARALAGCSAAEPRRRTRSPGKGSHRRPGERAHRWRSWGSDHIGQRVRRTVFGSDGVSAPGHADGTVVAWLDEHESDFVDGTGARAALWRVRYDDDGLLTGDHEDLELHELLASAAPAEAAAAAEDAALARKANCHFAEITADDARPGLNVAASVVGVFVVATRNIAAGEPLLVSYGKEFWAGWAQRKARLDDLEAAADDLVDAARDALAAPDDAAPARTAARRSPEARGGRRVAERRRRALRVGARRGAMRWRGVVVGLVVDAPDAGLSARCRGRARAEGYWRGSPPWPATVGAVGADGRLSLAYDDGGVEDDVPPGLCRSATRPPAWRAARRLAVGTWVRRIDPPKDDAPPEGPKKKKLKKPPKQEGVVAALRDDGAFDVLDDDGTLVEQCTARDWEPLLVLRYEEGHDQRVVSMAQLRHLKPQFLDARTLRRPRLDDGDGDLPGAARGPAPRPQGQRHQGAPGEPAPPGRRRRVAAVTLRAASDWIAAGYDEQLAARLVGAGLDAPTPIQAACFRALAAGGDGVVHAETGSGKTLAYAAPLARGGASSVVAPGLPLVAQIRRVLDASLGAAAERFVVATPKQLIAHRVDDADVVVLDEADALLRPAGKYASAETKARKRERPAAKCLRRFVEANPEAQVVAASATVGRPLRREIDGIVRGAAPVFAEKRPSIPVLRATAPTTGRAVSAPAPLRHVVAPFWDKRTGRAVRRAHCAADALAALGGEHALVVLQDGDVGRTVRFLEGAGHAAADLATVLGGVDAVPVAAARDVRGLDLPGVSCVVSVGRPRSCDEYLHLDVAFEAAEDVGALGALA
ncbi:helicase [Aureococcus anophagefferens]|nr:helicase [Aureococcus anophagefferens]